METKIACMVRRVIRYPSQYNQVIGSETLGGSELLALQEVGGSLCDTYS